MLKPHLQNIFVAVLEKAPWARVRQLFGMHQSTVTKQGILLFKSFVAYTTLKLVFILVILDVSHQLQPATIATKFLKAPSTMVPPIISVLSEHKKSYIK